MKVANCGVNLVSGLTACTEKGRRARTHSTRLFLVQHCANMCYIHIYICIYFIFELVFDVFRFFIFVSFCK